MTTADLPKDGKPPLTFPPDLAFKKGSVTAAAAAYNPSGGFLFGKTICLLFRGGGKPQA